MKKLIKYFLIWLGKTEHSKNFLTFLSVIVGFLAGLSAILIKKAIHFTESIIKSPFLTPYHHILYLIFPAIGIFFTILLLKYVFKKKLGLGIPSVLAAISRTQGKIYKGNIFSSIITSSFTVGFGGSVGLEGPIAATGAAIGSNVGQYFRVTYKQMILLIGAGTAGAVAGIFKAPITGVIFALEILMIDLTLTSIIPLIFASITATITTISFLGFDVIYKCESIEKFNPINVPYYLILGLLCAFMSLFFTSTYQSGRKLFKKIKNKGFRLLVGAFILGIILFFFPSLYGEGFEVINSSLKGNFEYLFNGTYFNFADDNIKITLLLFLSVLLLKVIAATTTIGAGGVGGIFAPSLFLGSTLGLFFGILMQVLGFQNIPLSNFALVGMAGLISGNLHAPLTAIFLIAEITGGYELFIPLMIVSIVSFYAVKMFQKHSIENIELAEKGELMTHAPDSNILIMMDIKNLIEKDFSPIKPNYTLGQLVRVISSSKRNIFPVIDEENNFKGVVTLDSVRQIIFNRDLYEIFFVRDLMALPSFFVSPENKMNEVVDMFQTSEFYNLPVLDNGKYLGFVSKSKVFYTYRTKIKEFSAE